MSIIRGVVAGVWIYQGLWCKALGRVSRHGEVVGSVPFLNARAARITMLGIGCIECILAVWILSGREPMAAAVSQSALLIAMNAGGLIWARDLIPDPAGMVVQNAAFLTLAWVGAYAIHN